MCEWGSTWSHTHLYCIARPGITHTQRQGKRFRNTNCITAIVNSILKREVRIFNRHFVQLEGRSTRSYSRTYNWPPHTTRPATRLTSERLGSMVWLTILKMETANEHGGFPITRPIRSPLSPGLSSNSGLTIRWPIDYLHLGASRDPADINVAPNVIVRCL